MAAIAKKLERNHPFKFNTLGQRVIVAELIADANPAEVYVWIAHESIAAEKRKRDLMKLVNGKNLTNLLVGQNPFVKEITATIVKKEMLSLIEVRKKEKSNIITLLLALFTFHSCIVIFLSL